MHDRLGQLSHAPCRAGRAGGQIGWRVKIIRRALFGGFLLWLLLLAWITAAGLPTRLHKADCILVLGARSLPDGLPGPSLQARCLRAVELWRQQWAPAILFTGGRGASGTVEGVVGMDFARARGVPQSSLYFEGASHTTWENFLYASQVMRQHGWRSCLVVTDPFHEARALSMARRFGLEAHPAPTFEGPAWRRWGPFCYYTMRESASWAKYLFCRS